MTLMGDHMGFHYFFSDSARGAITVLEMDPRGPKNGRSKICPFLYSNGHTEAKKYLKIFSTDATFYVIKNMLEFF